MLHGQDIKGFIDQVTQNGYVVIPNAFSPSQMAQAKAEVARISAAEGAGPAAAAGRNAFEGFQTQRIYALLNKSRLFDPFVVHPAVLALNDHFLDHGYLINVLQSINIRPGEDAQALHHDDEFITLPRPRRALGTGVMIALDAYTETNGATVVVPGSHAWGDRRPERSEAVPVTMPAGSIMFFLSTLWHGGGQNTSGESRLAVTVQYCQPWVRPMENQLLAVDWEKLDGIHPRIVAMMGYKVGMPFIGYVDGRSPRTRVAELLDRWSRQAKL